MPDDNTRKSPAPLYVSLAIVLCLVLSYFFIPGVSEFMREAWDALTSNDQGRIRSWVGGYGALGPIILIAAMIVQMFLLVIPTIVLMVVSIMAYGPVWGSIIIVAAVFASTSVGYFIGRFLGEGRVQRLIGPKTDRKVAVFVEDYGFWAVIITRLNPFLSNDAISFVGGVLRMGYWKFIGATLLGTFPLTLFLAVMGKSTDRLKHGLLWCSLASLVGFILYVWWDRRARPKKH